MNTDLLVSESITFLKDLVENNAYTKNAEGVRRSADRVVKQFSSWGFREHRVACDQEGTGDHLFLDSGGDGPTIACISHLDTVYPAEEEDRYDFHWKQKGMVATGPGTVDIHGGTALLWLTLALLRASAPERFAQFRWLLAWNAAEEILTHDFTTHCKTFLPESTKACLVFEQDQAKEDNQTILITERKGMSRYAVKVTGQSAHAGNNHGSGANAIHQLARVIENLQRMTDYEKAVTVNVGKIWGGCSTNRVPDEAHALLEMRSFDPDRLEAAHKKILGFQGEGDVVSQKTGYRCRIEINAYNTVSPWPKNAKTDLLASAWEKAAQKNGIGFATGSRGGLSDGNFLAREFPTLDGLGPRGGRGHISQSDEGCEFIDLSSMLPKARLNAEAILSL